ncbi:hypothetical protein C7Y70_19465 [Pseudoalteromonas sp. KS88]|uniref:hypothetical protein n=1 Tax=Pseudoalteromonas sp. KS88 TaxID=2109918 RepID=UPI001081DC49|nr:hypothetical protein [Pseudoalteromonas sp. KS88]TGE76348.1 hypothetical protein C7Y70_19465 [Pseudoalteromonas sp. KS88]
MMKHTKSKLALGLYAFATLFSLLNLVIIVVIHWGNIVLGGGLNPFATFWFAFYFVISFVAWLIACFVERNRCWGAAYWLTIAGALVLIAFVSFEFSPRG